MIERGVIRVLTVPNRTHCFVDGARERGIVAEGARAFEEAINRNLPKKEAVSFPKQDDVRLVLLLGFEF